MSLAPIGASLPGWSSIASQRLPPAQPAPDNVGTDLQTSDIRSASQLNDELEAQKESSLTYQLIRQLLIQHSESESLSIDTEAIDISLARSQSSELTVAFDDSGLSISWIQTESFTASIVGEGFSLSIAGSRVQSFQLELEREVGQSDPLQLDLAGDGFETSGLDEAVRFDLRADGRPVQTSVAADDDALLALDRNGNGRIDNGKELFGDQHGHRDGYALLREFDDNHDRLIDASDRIFSALRLLRWHGDGQQQLLSLSQANIVSISLNLQSVQQQSDQGDAITADSAVRLADGSERRMAEIWYRYLQAS